MKALNLYSEGGESGSEGNHFGSLRLRVARYCQSGEGNGGRGQAETQKDPAAR